ncbi:hypothetical protein C5167_003554 [Papaver somniferum]|uniref:C2 domain-containing protein n=1 Tax=Papaver somniferum TaxID=3469 RepID=A0A4Y7L1D6_PAPSO|nr:uncharacterized protein LOC113310084 [Papaver somniferum]RZC79363.1 hypothetical protein C5167_003554 [Papaver somniferum]
MKKLKVEVCMISARGLNRPSSLWKLQWYAVGWIDPNNKYCTKVDASGSKNPTWKTKFSAVIADDNDAYESKSPTLKIQVFSREPIFLREKLQGTATILLREFVDKYYSSTSNVNNSSSPSSGSVEEVGSFQLRKKTSGKPQGLVDVSVRIFEDRDDVGGRFPTYHYSGNNGEGFELGGGERGGSQMNEIFIGGGRWSNVEDQRLRHHHHHYQSDPDSHPQPRPTAQGRWSDPEDYPHDPRQLPDYSNPQQDYPRDPHQPPDHSRSQQRSEFHGGGLNVRDNHPHANTQPKDHSQSPETQGRWSNADDDHHISPQPPDDSQQRSPQGRWSNVRRRRHHNTNNQQKDSQSQSELQPEIQGGWSNIEDHHHSSQQQPRSQSRTAAPPNWRQPKGVYPDSQSMMPNNNSNQQSFSAQSTQGSYRPPPPPPPPPSHVGFLPSFLPRADPRFSSAYADNRGPGGGTAPAGQGAGPQNNSGAAMGMSAGALAAGVVLFGDDFISGFDIPPNLQEETPYYY